MMGINYRVLFVSGFLVLVLTGCTTIEGGRLIRDKQIQEYDEFQALVRSAHFEIDCPKEELELRVIEDVNTNIIYSAVLSGKVGVSGCGRRAVYVYSPNNQYQWLLNSATTQSGKIQTNEPKEGTRL